MPATQTYFPPVEVKAFRGQNSALNLADLPVESQALAKNAMMREIGTIGKRDGSGPIIQSALGSAIRHVMRFPFEQEVAIGAAPTGVPVGDASSTLPAGTYYVRYTFASDTGETQASSEISVVVPPAVANPVAAPVLAQSADGTETLPDTTYYVAHTWKNAVGETMVSPEASILITAGNRLDITIPALPSGATSASIYAGTVSGTLKFQSNIATTTTFINAPILTVTAPPVANTCIVAKLRVTVPAVPFHANQTNVYISTTTNTEKLQGNTTTTTFDKSTVLSGTTAYPTTNTTAFRNEILVASGTALYSIYNNSTHTATMTDALVTSDIYDIDFTNSSLTERKLIADTGDLKQYTGSTVVDVTPAADDASPAPANVLASINTKGNKFIWEHTGHVFVSPGTNEVFYSKRYKFDYFPETFYELLVKDGDYINGCGVSFDSVCFIPMRRGWNVLTGTTFDDFDSSEYLNTNNGAIAPRSIDTVNYPNGFQTVLYLSDDGVYEIFTTTLDTQGRQYATRNIMTDKIDFASYGFTVAEKQAAKGKYITKFNMYLLEIVRNATSYVFGFDTRNAEWYVWQGLDVNSFLESEGVVYFAGDDGFLKKFNEDWYTDYTNYARTTGTVVDFDVYSGLLSFGFDGHQAYLDYYLVEAKQWTVVSKLDVYITYGTGVVEVPSALVNQIFVWGTTDWSEAEWANTNYTDILNNARRIIVKRKGFYFQRRWRNNRDEPVLIYKERYMGRLSGK